MRRIVRILWLDRIDARVKPRLVGIVEPMDNGRRVRVDRDAYPDRDAAGQNMRSILWGGLNWSPLPAFSQELVGHDRISNPTRTVIPIVPHFVVARGGIVFVVDQVYPSLSFGHLQTFRSLAVKACGRLREALRVHDPAPCPVLDCFLLRAMRASNAEGQTHRSHISQQRGARQARSFDCVAHPMVQGNVRSRQDDAIRE